MHEYIFCVVTNINGDIGNWPIVIELLEDGPESLGIETHFKYSSVGLYFPLGQSTQEVCSGLGSVSTGQTEQEPVFADLIWPIGHLIQWSVSKVYPGLQDDIALLEQTAFGGHEYGILVEQTLFDWLTVTVDTITVAALLFKVIVEVIFSVTVW